MNVLLKNVDSDFLTALNGLIALAPKVEIESCIYTKDEIKRELDESVAQIESGNFVGYTEDEIRAELGL